MTPQRARQKLTVPPSIHISSAEVITNLGAEHSPLSPNTHLRIFIWNDLLAALLQGIGLAVTFSGARPAGNWRIRLPAQAAAGQSVLFTGLFLQCLGLAGALVCLTMTYMRAGSADRKYASYSTFHRDNNGAAGHLPLTPRSKTFLAILPLAGVCVLVRCAYRAAAAWGGLGSPVARDDVLWLVAEGVLFTEAIVTLAVFHPAIWLYDTVAAAATRQHRRPRDDMEEATVAATGPGGARQGANTRMSMFSMGSYSTRAAKRLSYATTIGDTQEPEHAQMQMHHSERDSRANLHEVSQLMFQSRLIAPSDAGSSSAANSRRGSSGSSQPDPCLHRPGLYDEDPSPYDTRGNHRYSVADDDDNNNNNNHIMISPDTRDLSPLEAEAEADRISIAPEVPRKSSKRVSRLLSPGFSAAGASGSADDDDNEEEDDHEDDEERFEVPRKSSKRMSRLSSPPSAVDEHEDDDDDRLEVESVILPLRKPSRKETTDDTMEEVTLKSTYSTSLYSQ